jgi:uncharacterized delta-60 repeat protein
VLALLGGSLLAVGAYAPSASAAVGALDTSFGQNNGFSTVSVGSTAGAAAVAVQSDGKIVTAGQATIDGTNAIVATRMDASGNLDPTFGTGGITTMEINGGSGVDSGAAIALQGDGKIVIAGGGHPGAYGPLAFAAVRLNTDGSPDSTFGTNGAATVQIGPYSLANAVVIQPDGKIVLAGTTQSSHNEFAATRLTANGKLDTGFGNHGITTLSPTGGAWGLVRQADGKLVLGGQEDYANPSIANAQQFMAARLNTNGTLDTSYGSHGIASVPVGGTSLGFGVALQSDGKAIVAGIGWTYTNVNAAVRLTTGGKIDRSYGSNGIAAVPDGYGANGIIIDSSGKVLLPATGPSILRLNTDGTPDQSFGNGGNLVTPYSGAANGAALQADGQIVMAGATGSNNINQILVERIG